MITSSRISMTPRTPILLLIALAAMPALASQTEVHTLQRRALLAGDGEGITVAHDGVVQVGKSLLPRIPMGSLPSGVVSMVDVGGTMVVATSAPGKLWRISGDKPVLITTLAVPLVTGLVAVDNKRVLALRSPSAGAVIIDIATGKQTEHSCDSTKMLLAAAADGSGVLAVGGGDEGTLVRFTPGKPTCEVVATTTESMLRSIAVATIGTKKRVVVGGAEDGLVYELMAGQLVAIADALAEEVTGVAITSGGVVFAAAVDSDGKLSKMAGASKDNSDDDDSPKRAKKAQPRRVKASEVWRIETGGTTEVVWQSKSHGIYAMVATGAEVWFGSGSAGRLYKLDERANQRSVVLDARDGVDEITAFATTSQGLWVGSAHAAGVWQLSPATEGVWTSSVLDMDVPAVLGSVRIDGKGTLAISMRTGNTSDAKQSPSSWSPWSSWQPWQGGSIEADGTNLRATTASRYAQVRIKVSSGAEVRGLYLSYLRHNRAPEIVAIDVLAPGWKLVASPREGPETRSVNLNERPFNRFLDRAGAQLPKLDERPYAKQSFDVGFRTIYAFAEDDDKDALRYRFSLARLGSDGKLGAYAVVKDWSDEPFWSAEASRLIDGQYAVMVDVDDAPTNGPARLRSAQATSAPFVVSHVIPRVQGSVVRTAAGMLVELDIDAALPVVVARCTTGLADWLPLDPIDGMLDNRREKLKGVLPASAGARGVSCEVYDEGVNFARVELLAR
jgi:hypothetical protein